MGLRVKKNKNQSPALVIDGTADISLAAELRNEIINLMAESDTLTVDMDAVDHLDVSCVQLLCSANRSFEEKGKHFSVRLGKSDKLCRNVLGGSGYDPHNGCPEKKCATCLWKGKN